MSERFIARVLLQTCNKVITRVLVVGIAFLLGYHGTSLLYCSVPSKELRVRTANKDWSFSPSRRHLLASNDSGSNYPPDIFSLEQRRQGAVILHIFGMVYMFLALAVVCDEFFVPALGVITRKLHISDDVSGATFMAAGGSAPELFTSFIGVFIANSDVGIGTIVGSAVFNILFVIGVCALVSKDALRLTWWPLFRDVTFYSVSLLILIAFFYDGKIYWWEAFILFLLYVAYVVFMKYTHIIEAKVKVYICRSNSVNSMAIPEQTTRHIPFLPANSALTGRFRHGVLQLLLHSIDPFSQVKVQEKSTHFPTPDILQIVADHEATLNYISSMSHNNKGQEAIHEYISTISHNNRNEGATLACKGNISLDNRNEGATLDCNINISHNNRNEGATLDCKSNTSLDNKNDGATLDWKSNISLDNKDQGAAFAFNSSNKFQVDKDQGVTLSYSSNISQIDKEQVINRDYNSVVSPLQENDKQPSQDILQRDSNANQKEPTVPMNENTEPWDPDSKSEVTPDDEEPLDLSWPKTCASRTSFVFLAPIVFPLWVTLPDVRRQEKRKFFVLTFIGSVLWIAFFSYLMVWWANQSGETIGIPDGIMGLTILAAGTSIPDLITSVIVTKKGLGDMAVSSSLGSNIFDITVGLPLPWLMYGAVNGGAAYRVNSTGLLCSIVLLFVMLVAVVATIAVCRWRMSKLLGLTMLVLYVVFIVLSVLLEMEIIKCPV